MGTPLTKEQKKLIALIPAYRVRTGTVDGKRQQVLVDPKNQDVAVGSAKITVKLRQLTGRYDLISTGTTKKNLRGEL